MTEINNKIKINDEVECFFIVPGGYLYEQKWVSPIYEDDDDLDNYNVTQEGYYETIDRTESLPAYLYSSCKIYEGTTLRDIFKLMNRHRDFFEVIQKHNYFSDFIDWVLNDKTPNKYDISDYSSIEYFSINFNINFDEENDNDYPIDMYWNFSGKTYPITEEHIELSGKENVPYEVGERAPMGFLISGYLGNFDKPIKIEPTKMFSDKSREVKEYPPQWIDLGEIFEAILYEMSFHGSPEEGKEFEESLKNISNEVQLELDEFKEYCEENNLNPKDTEALSNYNFKSFRPMSNDLFWENKNG